MNDKDHSRATNRRCILIDIGHPAHVHLFRNFASQLQKNGIPYLITSREKDLTNLLLDHYGLNYISISQQGKTMAGQFLEFLLRTFKILKLHNRHHFTHAIGTSVSIGYLSLLTFGKVKSYNFCEDDDDAIPLQCALAYPFSTKIINPNCLRFHRWKSKRILLPTFHELAYLHPENFTANPDVPKKYDLEPGKYIIIRLSSLQAHHDRNEKGIDPDLLDRIREIASEYKIIESREIAESHLVSPWDMHDLLAFSALVVADSQTMTAEAALLGTPSIRVSTFKNRLSYLDEIESRVPNAFSFQPHCTDSILTAVGDALDSESKGTSTDVIDWIRSEKIDLTAWMQDKFMVEAR